MRKYLKDLYIRKDLMLYLVTSGLKSQHRNNFLGYFWWLLDPLLGILIYYFVVVVIFNRGSPDFGVYLVVGMVVWRWLGSTVSSASKAIIGQAGVISQVYLPKAIFPIGAALTQLINFGFGLLVIAIFCLFLRVAPGLRLLWLPLIVLAQLFFMIALAVFTAYVCVFIRDIDNTLNHLMRLWFFGSPVIWQADVFPSRFHWVLDINPMTHFLAGYRNIIIYNQPPNLAAIILTGIVSAAFIIVTIYYYSINEHRIIKAV